MTGLPKKYAKMGFSKGWRAFKSAKHSIKSKGGQTMARRKHYGKRSSRRTRGSFGSAGIAGNAVNVAISAGSAVAYEKWLEPMIPINDVTTKTAVSTALGLLLASQPNKYMKSAGIGIATVNAYQLIGGFMGGTTSASNSQANLKVYS